TRPRTGGLGLAPVYGGLVPNRGGFRLRPGQKGGVVARVYLPVAAEVVLPPLAPESADLGGAPAPAGRAGTDGKILVVDDDPGVLGMISDTLPHGGCPGRTDA